MNWKTQMIMELQKAIEKVDLMIPECKTLGEQYKIFMQRKRLSRALTLVRGFEG